VEKREKRSEGGEKGKRGEWNPIDLVSALLWGKSKTVEGKKKDGRSGKCHFPHHKLGRKKKKGGKGKKVESKRPTRFLVGDTD